MAKYHVERFPLEVPAPHARVHEGERLQIGDCRLPIGVRIGGVAREVVDEVFPRFREAAVRIELVIGAAQAVLQEPLDHVRLGEELGDGRDLGAGCGLAAAVQLGVGARLGLFLVKLIRPADGVGVGEGRVGFFGRVARGCRTDERHATQEGRGAGSQRRRGIGQVKQAGKGGCLCPARILDHRPPAAIGAGRAAGCVWRRMKSASDRPS